MSETESSQQDQPESNEKPEHKPETTSQTQNNSKSM